MHTCSAAAYERIQRLDTLVVLNGDTLLQYQDIKFQTMSDVFLAQCSRDPRQTLVSSVSGEELEDFFDAYSKFPEDSGDYFFDANEELEDSSTWDLLRLSDDCMPTAFVDYIRITNEDPLKQESLT